MKRNQTTASLVVLTIAGVATALAWAGERVPERVPERIPVESESVVMQAKLNSCQRILNGLVSKNFLEIERGAKELNRSIDAMAVEGQIDQVYLHHQTEMRRLTHKLLQATDDRNLDGASFTYMHTLTVCISCHEHCRDVLKITEAPVLRTPGAQGVVPIPVEESEATRPYEEPVIR
ncbi:MAG: hypothetical protein KDA78_18990 [Planctomycetaceae bacterium]|nr:hypothetical protein [Planctomycetaceae bacterium]